MKRPRAKHNTVRMGGQVFHIAGYAKDYSVSPTQNNGRRVEKWENMNPSASQKVETGDQLFNYVSPQSFIVTEEWYVRYCKK